MGCTSSPPGAGTGVWLPLPSVTSGKDYGLGVSAPFMGTLPDGRLAVAGGCNFPGVPAAAGGAKRYYADIFTLDTSDSLWRHAGELPQALAYGASASVPEGILCAGGTDTAGHAVRETFLLTCDSIRPLAPLPQPLDNCAGAYLDGRFYVLGGRAFYIYDFAADAWREGPLWPGAERRVQPVAVAQAGKVWLFGGYDPEGPEFVTGTGYAYDPATDKWEAIPGPVDAGGLPLLAAGGTGVAWGEDSILCFGGVDTEIFTEALKRGQAVAADPENDSLRQAQREYMGHEAAWYRFNDRVLVYNTSSGRWTVWDTPAPQSARAGAAAAAFSDKSGIVLFNGELKPGVRTPQVWHWKP